MFLLAPPTMDDDLEPVERRSDLGDHPRVARSARYREDLRVCSDRSGTGVLVVGRGLAGRWEMSVEVAPANAASERAILAAGYRPSGAEVLFLRGS